MYLPLSLRSKQYKLFGDAIDERSKFTIFKLVKKLKNMNELLKKMKKVEEMVAYNNREIIEMKAEYIEYIDEIFEGPSILPKDPYDQSIAHFWTKFLDDEEKEKAKEESGELLKILENELKDEKFFVGDKIGFADIAANLLAYWMQLLEEDSGVVLMTSTDISDGLACDPSGSWAPCGIPESNVQDDDLTIFVDHITRINKLVQEVVSAGGLLSVKKKYMALRSVLPNDFQKKLLDKS
ncbi:putative glutathione S-transferase [Capsicum chinense]|nr:putative glutathione S-transferase [Capsicum chinense]